MPELQNLLETWRTQGLPLSWSDVQRLLLWSFVSTVAYYTIPLLIRGLFRILLFALIGGIGFLLWKMTFP